MYYDVQKSAERIRKLRENRGLTQNEAAEEMGFSFGGYRKLECGLNGGSIDSLMLVAEFYHVSLDYLVYGEKPEYISCLLNGLTEKQKCIVLNNMANLVENLRKFQ
ncbi:MAG: helix-turn-helix transcriptional regulator [Lachnospiraceae bacterium]|jgi:transcriptional regulator with XRE-family HTH domain|nr:helix-turn-helix transcriptional regulator [Lachnospiraceae bacterium]MCI9448453.1 helix-turn-helix transcriptional regulator [Lachnospiraceae bacterium]